MVPLVAVSATGAAVGGGVLADAAGGGVLSVAIVTAVSAVVVALIGAVVAVITSRGRNESGELMNKALDSAIERAERAEAALDREHDGQA